MIPTFITQLEDFPLNIELTAFLKDETVLLEAKKATTEGEKKSLQERMFTKYYTGLDKVSEKGARKFTPVADKAAGKVIRVW